MIEAPLDSLEEAVNTAQQAMADASDAVLDGLRFRSDAKIIRYPDRYRTRGGENVDTVWTILQHLGIGDLCNLCTSAHPTCAPVQHYLCTSAHPYSLISYRVIFKLWTPLTRKVYLCQTEVEVAL